MTHLVVGTPCYGGMVTHQYSLSLLKLQKECEAQGIGFDVHMIGGDALITRARNNIATQFLDNPAATHLMFIDADIGFEPGEVIRLLQFNVDIAGGLYPIKRIDWPWVQQCIAEGRDNIPASLLHYVIGFEDEKNVTNVDGFAKAKHIGNGFMLIKRHVFDVLKQKYPELKFTHNSIKPDPNAGNPNRYAFFDCIIDEDGTYLPEDYTFCQRWLNAGGEIWVDLKSKLNHLGMYNFAGDASTVFKPVV